MSDSRSVVVREEKSVSLGDMQTMAKSIAESGMFGIKTEAQAMALMLLCQAEGIHPVMALRRYHIIEGKPAYRADALQGEFEREGGILWHQRDEKECAATFFRNGKAAGEAGIKRAVQRYQKLKAGQDASDLAWPGELTIIRTLADAIEKKVAMSWDIDKKEWKLKKNWRQSPRQMLHARCLTEGVRAINPGLVAGIYTEDEIHDFSEAEIEAKHTEIDYHGVAERNVREATANATGEVVEVNQEDDGSVTTVEQLHRDGIQLGPYGPIKVTTENYKDRIAHFGKPSGRIIGRRVGDMEEPVIRWLRDKWIPTLNPSASDDDMALKTAIEFAVNDRAREAANAAHDAGELDPPTAGSEARKLLTEGGAADVGAKQAAVNDLRERIDSLVLTEEQAVSYLIKYFYTDAGANWKTLDELPLNVLLEWCVPVNWKAFRARYEAEVKPQVNESKPAKRRRK